MQSSDSFKQLDYSAAAKRAMARQPAIFKSVIIEL